MKSSKNVVMTDDAPRPIGPYSMGVQSAGLIFTAGQIGILPGTGELIPGGLEPETRQALLNLQAILKAAGADLNDVLKTTVFLRDMQDFSAMNAVYAEFFTREFPARSAIQAAALPKGAAVEIEAIARLPQG